jgi:hypothetical protein
MKSRIFGVLSNKETNLLRTNQGKSSLPKQRLLVAPTKNSNQSNNQRQKMPFHTI